MRCKPRSAHPLEHSQQGHVRQSTAGARAWKDVVASSRHLSHLAEDPKSAATQGHAVLATTLHPLGRNNPNCLREIDFLPSSSECFARPRGRQYRKLERSRGDSGLLAKRRHEPWNFVDWQCCVVPYGRDFTALREHMVEVPPPSRRVVAGAMAPHARPIENRFNAPAQPGCCLGSSCPDRLEHS